MQKIGGKNPDVFKYRSSEEDDFFVDDELQEVARTIKELPELDAPAGLMPSVMDAIQRRELLWYQRLYNWAKAPLSVSFTPLHIAASIALLILCTLLATQFLQRNPSHLVQSQNESVPVAFTVNLPGAQSVAVVGSFNQWRPQGFEMHDGEHHEWILTLELPEGRYEYAFLVDGREIIPDPHASLYQNDGFGNRNAVLILGTKNEKAI